MSKAPVKKVAAKKATKVAAKKATKAAPTEAPKSNLVADEETEKEFAARFREIYDDIADYKSDLKELRAEAKAAGVDYKIVEKATRNADLTEAEREEREYAEARADWLARVLGKEWARERKAEDRAP